MGGLRYKYQTAQAIAYRNCYLNRKKWLPPYGLTGLINRPGIHRCIPPFPGEDTHVEESRNGHDDVEQYVLRILGHTAGKKIDPEMPSLPLYVGHSKNKAGDHEHHAEFVDKMSRTAEYIAHDDTVCDDKAHSQCQDATEVQTYLTDSINQIFYGVYCFVWQLNTCPLRTNRQTHFIKAAIILKRLLYHHFILVCRCNTQEASARSPAF